MLKYFFHPSFFYQGRKIIINHGIHYVDDHVIWHSIFSIYITMFVINQYNKINEKILKLQFLSRNILIFHSVPSSATIKQISNVTGVGGTHGCSYNCQNSQLQNSYHNGWISPLPILQGWPFLVAPLYQTLREERLLWVVVSNFLCWNYWIHNYCKAQSSVPYSCIQHTSITRLKYNKFKKLINFFFGGGGILKTNPIFFVFSTLLCHHF